MSKKVCMCIICIIILITSSGVHASDNLLTYSINKTYFSIYDEVIIVNNVPPLLTSFEKPLKIMWISFPRTISYRIVAEGAIPRPEEIADRIYYEEVYPDSMDGKASGYLYFDKMEQVGTIGSVWLLTYSGTIGCYIN